MTYGRDSDFIVSINFNRYLLITRLLPYFIEIRHSVNYGGPYRFSSTLRGRKPYLDSIDILGLVLRYLKSRDSIYRLCPIFGIVPGTISVWLDYAMEVLFRVMQRTELPDIEIHWPTLQEMEVSTRLLQRNRQYGPLLKGVLAVMDGGCMPCPSYVQPDLQNAYWEGFTQAHEVSNLFMWNFSGELIHAGIKFPGSWPDSRIASGSGLYCSLLMAQTQPGFAMFAESAFPQTAEALQGKIVRTRKDNERQGGRDVPRGAYLATTDLLLEKPCHLKDRTLSGA